MPSGACWPHMTCAEPPRAALAASALAAYVHWPYCTTICPYCDFNVYQARRVDDGGARLADQVLRDIEGWAARVGVQPLSSIYLGGGTPSLLEPAQIRRWLEGFAGVFRMEAQTEITLEVNPEDADAARLRAFVDAGITRFSIGAQALDDDSLTRLGRFHDRTQSLRAIEVAAHTGARVSADFIYARHGQTLNAWQAELQEILQLPVEHLSLYQLTVEPGTAFAKAFERGHLQLPDDDDAADFLNMTHDLAESAGFQPYEISNFARQPAARSRHNLAYWTGRSWLGVGPGAHGRLDRDGVRVATEAARRPAAYGAQVERTGWGVVTEEVFSPADALGEDVVMGLRLAEGWAPGHWLTAGGETGRLASLLEDGFLEWQAGRLRVPRTHRALTDRIASDVAVQLMEAREAEASPAPE